MIQVSVEQAVKDLRKSFRNLSQVEFNKGVSRAINHTLGKVRTESSREIRQVYNILARDLNKSLIIRRSNPGQLVGYVIAQGKPIPLHKFAPRKTDDGVSIMVKKGSRSTVKSAFITTMKNSKTGVFARGQYNGKDFAFRHKRLRPGGGSRISDGKRRPMVNDLSINELTTLSVPRAFANGVVVSSLKRKISEDFPKRLVHELFRMENRGRS